MRTEDVVGWALVGISLVVAVVGPLFLERKGWARPWQRTFAIVGVFVAFVFWIVPGFLAIFAYRRWQRGERGTPQLLVGLGLFLSTFVGLFMTVILVLSLALGQELEM